MEAVVFQLPEWLNVEFILRVLDSKIFSAIYWGGAAVVAVVGLIAKIKYRDANLKKLLDAYVKKAEQAEGKERNSVKHVIECATNKAHGRPNYKEFNPSDVFEDAARMFAQSQPHHAIQILSAETIKCEATIDYAQHKVRLARERAATAYLEIGMIYRHLKQGLHAVNAFTSMLRVNPGDLDALQMRGTQRRDLGQFVEAEGDFRALEYYVAGKPAEVANVKRDLGAVFLGAGDYARAETVLNEAMSIEQDLHNQRGMAITHEEIGTVRTARKRWKQAKTSYQQSKTIFELLGDAESARGIDTRVRLMEETRSQELQRRREKQKNKTLGPTLSPPPSPSPPPQLLH